MIARALFLAALIAAIPGFAKAASAVYTLTAPDLTASCILYDPSGSWTPPPGYTLSGSPTPTCKPTASIGTPDKLSATTLPTMTVATLPKCDATTQAQMNFVTDALAPIALSPVAGAGAVKVGVICNGSSWIVL